MATARKLPSGNYRCRIYLGKVNGKDSYKSFTAPTKKEAELNAIKYLNEHNQNKKVIPVNEFTFDESLEKYITLKESVLSPSTVREYKGLHRNCDRRQAVHRSLQQ